jgi:hypothetical protein
MFLKCLLGFYDLGLKNKISGLEKSRQMLIITILYILNFFRWNRYERPAAHAAMHAFNALCHGGSGEKAEREWARAKTQWDRMESNPDKWSDREREVFNKQNEEHREKRLQSWDGPRKHC